MSPLYAIAAVLAVHDPITAAPDHDLIAAVLLYLRSGIGDAETRLVWSRWAYRSTAALVGRLHPLWRRVATVHRRVLTDQGLTVEVVHVSEQRLQVARELGDPADVLIHWCALATAEHDDGQCDVAAEHYWHIRRTWPAQRHTSTTPADQIVVLTGAVLAAGCGPTSRAVRHLDTHAQVLSGMDHAARQTAARWLALTETAHPDRCQYQPPAPRVDLAGRQQVWATLLDPAADLQPHRRRGRPEPGAAAARTPGERR